VKSAVEQKKKKNAYLNIPKKRKEWRPRGSLLVSPADLRLGQKLQNGICEPLILKQGDDLQSSSSAPFPPRDLLDLFP
jgi:hypothetical protein